MEIIKIVTLSLSSLLLVVVGLSRMFNPVKTYSKNSGINLPQDGDLLNEIRGVAGNMFVGGVIIALGTILPSLTFTSHIVAAIIFLGFALGRFVSISSDGKPNKQIASGIMFEIVLGAANVVVLLIT